MTQIGGASQQSDDVMQREHGLSRQLSTRQLGMIAIGGAIGTGLFLGSSLAVRTAGPAVVVTYCLGALISLLLIGALAEMAVAHPTAGSFGVYAELYLSPWAGFVVRYTYWAVQAIVIGGEATAVAIYCGFWFPQVPQWLWIAAFSAAIVLVNGLSVGNFGEFEYWFATIKVVAIVLFIVFGAAVMLGIGPAPRVGVANFTAHGGFAPMGWMGAWMALVFVIYSYMGSETVAVTAGEAVDPEVAVPRAMRSMLARLAIFYIGSMIVLIGVMPWNQVQPGAGVTASPFVRVFQLMGIPAAAHIVNFVVITAALSSMNCNFYLTSRMMFSLARGGYAPRWIGGLSSGGTPVRSLIVSSFGLAIAILVAMLWPESAYVYMFGIALFGGLFVWLMIFVTHLSFRKKWAAQGGRVLPVTMWGYPYTSIAGAVLVAAILVTTWWVPGMRIALVAGIPWLVVVSVGYFVWRKLQAVSPKP